MYAPPANVLLEPFMTEAIRTAEHDISPNTYGGVCETLKVLALVFGETLVATGVSNLS